MEVLADENVKTEWIRALRDDGHDVVRVVDVTALGEGAVDPDVLEVAIDRDRILLTADQADFNDPPIDFNDPPIDEHPGIVIVADVTRTGGEVRRALRRIDRSLPDLSDRVAYVSDWL